MPTVRETSAIFMFFIGSALIVLLMLMPMMIEQEHRLEAIKEATELDSLDFIGSWHLYAYYNIQSVYTFTRDSLTITENTKVTTHNWTFDSATKCLYVQYPSGWIKYEKCERARNLEDIKFERKHDIYSFIRITTE